MVRSIMKAARLYGKQDIRVDSNVTPGEVGPTDVRIDVAACGICGSDLHEYSDPEFTPVNEHPTTGASRPIVVGHEFSGVVSEAGEAVDRVAVSDRVAVHPNIPCNDCTYCAEGECNRCVDTLAVGYQTGAGGFAESAVVPEQQVHVLPDEIERWEGALVEPLAVGLHAIRRSGMQAGDSVGVFGCGPIGLTAVQTARIAGAKEIFVTEPNRTEPNDSCREIARQMGADVAFDPMEDDVATAVTGAADDGVEAAFEFARIGPAFNAAVRSTRHGGTITVGSISDGEISTDLDDVVTTERTIKGTHCYGFPPDLVPMRVRHSDRGTRRWQVRHRGLRDRPDPACRHRLRWLRTTMNLETEHVKVLVEP